MQTTHDSAEIAYGSCDRCAQWARGRAVRFRLGLASRGASPRTLEPDLRVLSSESAFVCAACEPALRTTALRRVFQRHLPALAAPILLFGLGLWRGVREDARLLEVAGAIAVALVAGAWFLIRWRREREAVVREDVFARHREAYARRLGRSPGELTVYAPASLNHDF